ncbi:hypothetical protein ABID23_000957 [Bartonella silvatica]|uniref:Uncharacterized protein n=1 Tax=Bartonella silvatica TaxID=357760 RepID=A0ABV2HHF6_9HYPH
MGSFVTFKIMYFLFRTLISLLLTTLTVTIYYGFIKRVRLYYKVKKELKKMLKERNVST